jgi:predicted dehydrogenase
MRDKIKSSRGSLRVGLVGTGFGSQVHLPVLALCPGVEVVGVCSAQRTRAEAAANAFGVPFFTDDYQELIDHDGIDLIDVCTPPTSHSAITMAALAKKKHVLCEKPFALDLPEATRMRDAAATAGVVHALNHEMRYEPLYRFVHNLIANGYLGALQVLAVNVFVSHGTDPTKEPYYWGWVGQLEKGGGFLNSLLSHHLDLIRYCFGEIRVTHGEVETLIRERPVLDFEYRDGDLIDQNSVTVGLRPVDADDTAMLIGTIGQKGLLAVNGSWSVRHAGGISFSAYGDEGAMHLHPDGKLFGARNNDSTLTELVPDVAIRSVEGHRLRAPFFALVEDLASTICNPTAEHRATYATFEDGVRLQQVIDDIRRPSTRRTVAT